MRHVDALSRNPIKVLFTHESQYGLTEKIYAAQQEDPEIKEILKFVLNGKNKEFLFSAQRVLYRINA